MIVDYLGFAVIRQGFEEFRAQTSNAAPNRTAGERRRASVHGPVARRLRGLAALVRPAREPLPARS